MSKTCPVEQLCNDLHCSIYEKNIAKFETILDEQTSLLGRLKPRLINDILVECIKISSSSSATAASNESSTQVIESATSNGDGVEFIEIFMRKLCTHKCYFVFSDDTCKSVVKLFVLHNRQFSPYSVSFLLRCYNLELIKQVFESNLVNEKCSGDCSNWHLMFVASYQERFFTHYFDTIFEGFLARFILLCKLRCSLTQKRFFLTWFAGSLHLYTDEYFLQNEEARFLYVLVKLFESLILNGLLTNAEFANLSNMLSKRNEEMRQMNSAKNFSSIFFNFGGRNENMGINDSLMLDEEEATTYELTTSTTIGSSYFPNLELLFPLSLKNNCRLAIKRAILKYTKNDIDKLPLPSNLKKFVFFEYECESVYNCFSIMKK